jgi:hypothetical protein
MATILQNSLSVQTGGGIVLATYGVDQSNVLGNTITGNAQYGIQVGSSATPTPGGDVITDNCITGFTTAVGINMTSHPGSVVSNTSSCGAPLESISISGAARLASTRVVINCMQRRGEA